MPFNWSSIIPYLIAGGGSIAGAVIGARASGSAAELSAGAASEAAGNQLEMTRAQLDLMRDIYDMDLGLQWPQHRFQQESLGNLARGMGSALPPSTFETPEDAPKLPEINIGGEAGGAAPPPGTGPPVYPGQPGPDGEPVQSSGPGPGGARDVGGGALQGASLGAAAGSVIPGVGTAIGAGVGAAAGGASRMWGRGRREADQIVPYQNGLTAWIKNKELELDAKIKDGTITDQDWVDFSTSVNTETNKFYDFAGGYDRAGPGARKTISGWVDPLLSGWRNKQVRPMQSRMYGGPVKKRQGGGPVGQSLSQMGQPYMVGEAGPEMYMPNKGRPQMVGMGGPEVRRFSQDGQIVPNHQLPGMGMGMMRKPMNLTMMANGMPSRAAGGEVFGPNQPAYGWVDLGGNNWYHEGDQAQGRWREDGTFINITANAIYDPQKDEGSRVTHRPEGAATSRYEGQDIIRQWGWSPRANGTWYNTETEDSGYWDGDIFVNQTTGEQFDINTGQVTDLPEAYQNPRKAPPPYGGMRSPYPVEDGEFLAPWAENFQFDPAAGGYQPFNREFRYAPGEHGYQPLNQQFEFNTEDLYKDPGYKFRLDQGNKAIERSASARGMVGSGATMKDMARWSQGLASQEYGAAYGRARGEHQSGYDQSQDARNRNLQSFGLQYGQTADAYSRSWQEYINRRNEWLGNQQRRYQRTYATSGMQ